MASRFVLRVSRSTSGRRPIFSSPLAPLQSLSDGFHSLGQPRIDFPVKWTPSQIPQLVRHSTLANAVLQRFEFSSTASPQPTEQEEVEPVDHDNPSQADLSINDLVKLVAEKEELLKLKHKELEKMQDKLLHSYADMENVINRTKREAENSKKFAIQNFAKSLLDVADNLGRASSVVKESFIKVDSSKDSIRALPLLKTLLEGVEMTDKQLAEVLRKFGVEKFDPINENFDPHRHHAVFQILDASKPPGTIAAVVKAGYMLYDRVLRPAEVGVTEALNNEATQNPGE